MMNKRALLWGGMVFAVVTAASCYLYGVVKTPRELAQQRINAIARTAGSAGTHDQAVHALPNSAEFDELTGRAPGFTPKLVTAITKVFGRTGFSYAGLTAPNKTKIDDLITCSNTTVSAAATAARGGGGGGGVKTDAEKVEDYIKAQNATLTGYKNTITKRLTAMQDALAAIDTTLAGKDATHVDVTNFKANQRKQLEDDIAANEESYNHLKHDYEWLINPLHGYQLEATDAQAGAAIKTKDQALAFVAKVRDLANYLQINFTDANLTASKNAAELLPDKPGGGGDPDEATKKGLIGDDTKAGTIKGEWHLAKGQRDDLDLKDAPLGKKLSALTKALLDKKAGSEWFKHNTQASKTEANLLKESVATLTDTLDAIKKYHKDLNDANKADWMAVGSVYVEDIGGGAGALDITLSDGDTKIKVGNDAKIKLEDLKATAAVLLSGYEFPPFNIKKIDTAIPISDIQAATNKVVKDAFTDAIKAKNPGIKAIALTTLKTNVKKALTNDMDGKIDALNTTDAIKVKLKEISANTIKGL